MKRSKMIEYIKDALYPHLPFERDITYIAECVLATIEGGNPSQEGMLPPEVEYVQEESGNKVFGPKWEDE